MSDRKVTFVLSESQVEKICSELWRRKCQLHNLLERHVDCEVSQCELDEVNAILDVLENRG